MGKLVCIVGGQFGSEAKGAVAAWLAAQETAPLICCRVAGPNAGHTVVHDDRTWRLRHLPTGLVTNPNATAVLAAGSEIDADVLSQERQDLAAWHRTYIDEQATLISSFAHDEEKELMERIGSTGKGVGAARAARVMREANLFGGDFDSATFMQQHLLAGGTVHVEGTQGFGLGLHAGYYPFCTSADCRAIDVLAQAGLSPWARYVTSLEVWVVFRTWPIRVAGNSGPLYLETSWASLGFPEEYTTVTNRVRRVGAWDTALARQALAANGAPSPNLHVALTHADQADRPLHDYAHSMGHEIELVGSGPTIYDYKRIVIDE